jgi:hypothetical protein
MSETRRILKHGELLPRFTRGREGSGLIQGALAALKTIPNLDVKQLSTETGPSDHGLDFNFILSFGQKKFKVAAEVKASGEPSLLRRSASWLRNLLTGAKYDYAIIVAPFVSREGAEICRDLGVGFMDLSGNCLLSLDSLYIERTGNPNKFKKPREIQSFFSPKSSRVIRCLLSDPKRGWTLKGLATETGVSIGLIHRIATALENNFFAKKEIGAFRLEDPARLLEAWREEYYRRAPKWSRYVVRAASIKESLTKLKTAATHHGVRYAFSGPSGASLTASYLVPTAVHLYVDVLREEFLGEIKADQVSSEGNLLIRVVEQENEFIGSRQVRGFYIASDLQLYLDLWAMGGRGQEAAEELRRERLHF